MERLIRRFLTVDYGSGSGDGYGDGYGDGSGSGSGYGDGYGSGSGYGDGDGSGYGIQEFCGKRVYIIDRIPTVLESVKGNYAVGFIVNHDLTTSKTFVARVGNHFAHGETLQDARRDAEQKHLQNIPIEDRVNDFLEKFSGKKTIKTSDLYEWHSTLTGSCDQGKKLFCSQHGIDLSGYMTIDEFISLTINQYGGDVIKLLKEKYESLKA